MPYPLPADSTRFRRRFRLINSIKPRSTVAVFVVVPVAFMAERISFPSIFNVVLIPNLLSMHTFYNLYMHSAMGLNFQLRFRRTVVYSSYEN
jgi:hypothetical protein